MAKKNFDDKSKKVELGRLIAKCRGNMSQRQLAKAIGIPPSNMTYIENGINVKMIQSPYKTVSVDTYKDLEIVRKYLEAHKNDKE